MALHFLLEALDSDSEHGYQHGSQDEMRYECPQRNQSDRARRLRWSLGHRKVQAGYYMGPRSRLVDYGTGSGERLPHVSYVLQAF